MTVVTGVNCRSVSLRGLSGGVTNSNVHIAEARLVIDQQVAG